MEKVERKYCSKCQRNQTVDKFQEGYKSCNTCLAKMKRHYERNSETILGEKKEYMKEYRQREEKCQICECWIKTCRRSKHEKTRKHINNMNKNKPIKMNLENQYLLTEDYLCCNE